MKSHGSPPIRATLCLVAEWGDPAYALWDQ
jgi:hypothetical protein